MIQVQPAAALYFKDREILLAERGYADLTKKKDLNLACRQNWYCPVWNESLFGTLGEPLHVHHIVPRAEGGKDSLSN
jgi:RNA-directed DNA polymerase